MSKDFDSEFADLLAQVNKVLKDAGEALNLVVEGMRSAGGYRQTYLQQQATSVASVVLDVNLLVNERRFQNVVGLCRVGFESRINLYAAMRVPDFAAQKYLAGANGHVKELEELIKGGAIFPLFQSELEHHRKLLDDMRRSFDGIQEKAWYKLPEVARAAGLMNDYEAHYSTMSKAVHNTPTGLAAKTDYRILIGSVLNLLNDAIETCAALVFFQNGDEGSPKPLTEHWEELVGPIANFQDAYGNLNKKLSNLTHETLRHSEN